MDRSKEIRNGDDIYMFDEVEHLHTLNGKALTGVTTLIDKTLAKPALLPWAVKITVEWIKNNCLLRNDNGYPFWEVTEPDLDNAKKEHNKKKTDAGDWGTRVHNACEIWCSTGKLPEPSDDIYMSVMNFVQFIQNNGFKVLAVEKSVWSKEWWIGGIFDLILEKDGKVYIADIKTSSGIYDSHFIQMGAYYKCLKELGWIKKYTGKLETIVATDGTISVVGNENNRDYFDGAIVINLKKDDSLQHCTSSALEQMVDTYQGIVTIYRNRATLDTITKAIKKGVQF